jgi:hypothetical protein
MRWHAKGYKKPEIGETRAVYKFAYLPTKVKGLWIWLEQYLSQQKFVENIVPDDFCGMGEIVQEWEEYDRRLP